ncbi:MAG: leucine-rich repeat protein, partial [Clostridia bacterium]|nr:leucine-rich repeat protein [Clostridia bacterium]
SLTSLGDNAFTDCSSLVSVMFHPELVEIGDSAFKDCNSLSALYFYGNEPQMDALKNETAKYNDDFLNADVYFYSDDPNDLGCWYLDDNNNPKLWK